MTGVEKPILFSGPMVRAILEGRKTQTRRVAKGVTGGTAGFYHTGKSPKYEKGDHLWVRETWAPMCRDADPYCSCDSMYEEEKEFHEHHGHYVEYRADTGNKRPGDWPEPEEHDFQDAPRWRPSIHMPKWACRIKLEITSVGVQRLCEITSHDAWAEGINEATVTPTGFGDFACVKGTVDHFRELWDGLNAKRGYGWDTNPLVWRIEFRRIV